MLQSHQNNGHSVADVIWLEKERHGTGRKAQCLATLIHCCFKDGSLSDSSVVPSYSNICTAEPLECACPSGRKWASSWQRRAQEMSNAWVFANARVKPSGRYSEQDWLLGIGLVARRPGVEHRQSSSPKTTARYRHNPRVAGFDLRPDPVGHLETWASELGAQERSEGRRAPDSGDGTRRMRAGTLRMRKHVVRITLPTWGTGDLLTDWSIAAIKGAKQVQPRFLLVRSAKCRNCPLVSVRCSRRARSH